MYSSKNRIYRFFESTSQDVKLRVKCPVFGIVSFDVGIIIVVVVHSAESKSVDILGKAFGTVNLVAVYSLYL